MSREAYQVPTLQPTESGYGGLSGGTQDLSGPVTWYQCGDCAQKVQLKKGDPIRCKECGHRVLYKTRTKRMVQFEAR